MKSQNQSGSAHVVIIVIIVLVIVGALGFVFWNNFLKPKANTETVTQTPDTSKVDDQQDTTPDVVEEPEVALVAKPTSSANGYTMSLKAPADWKTGKGEGGVLRTVISPDSTVVLSYGLQSVPVFGAEQPDKVKVDSLAWSAIDGFSDGLFVAFIAHSKSSYYYYFSLEPKSSKMNTYKAGDSVYKPGAFVLDTKPDVTLAYAYVAFNDLDPSNLNLKDIQAAFKTDDAETAQAIIESIVVTKK